MFEIWLASLGPQVNRSAADFWGDKRWLFDENDETFSDNLWSPCNNDVEWSTLSSSSAATSITSLVESTTGYGLKKNDSSRNLSDMSLASSPRIWANVGRLAGFSCQHLSIRSNLQYKHSTERLFANDLYKNTQGEIKTAELFKY